MHGWLLCSFRTLTCWLCWLIILIEDFDVSIFLCFIAISIWDFIMLIVLIDYLVCLSIVTLILPWLFCSLHMYRFIVVYHLTWWVNSLACTLSWSSLSMLSLSQFILIVIAYVDLSDIFVLCLTVCCMIAFLCVIACRLSVWAVYLSLYLQPSGFGHLFHYGSYFCKCEALCVFVSLTELEVRSRV